MSIFSDFWDTIIRPREINPKTMLGLVEPGGIQRSLTDVDSSMNSGFSDLLKPGAPKPPPIQSNTLSRDYDRHSASGQIGQQSQSDMPSIAEILARLEASSDPSRYMTSSDELMRQARSQADAQYNPVIAQLRNSMGQAETRGNTNRQALGEMFGQLSGSLQGDIAPLEQKAAQTQQQTDDQYTQLKSQIADTYKNTQADQEAMMQRLNIQAAAPASMANQQRDQAYFQNRANVDEQTAQTALQQESRGNTEYTRRGSEVARVEGTQRQADLMGQLSELLNSYQSQIGANEAAKESAVSSMFGQLNNQSQENAFKYSQRDFDNYLSSIGIGRQLKNDQFAQQSKPVQPVKSLSDVASHALSMGLPSSSAQKIQDVFSSAVGNDDRILGGINPTSGTPITKEQAAQYIVEAGRQQGLSQSEINALQDMALQYFGRV